MTDRVRIFEVGPRDGLQNEKIFVPTVDKIALIDLLSEAGFSNIEVASFVSPKWVPQMADGAAVVAQIARKPWVSYAALVPNLIGYERARAAGVDEVAVFASASEGFSIKNINCSIAESLARFEPIIAQAAADGIAVRAYVSCAIACPYDGAIAPRDVAALAARLSGMGCYEISLGDTIGAGTPESVAAMLDAVLALVPAERLAGHFHDTGSKGLANIETALTKGLRSFDSAIGGLGGCPYAPGAKGNIETLTVHDRLTALGFCTGLDRDRLLSAGEFLSTQIARHS
ncbi:MAG: hydroxymethylglutaryl-CoA lyase [Rhizobiales bacterium]|nr:hydroxymethylglutaryl-CoA lyase [Hyphomicrobiales bacterium]